MEMNASPLLTRRAALGRFAALLAAGLWPGALRAMAAGIRAEEFTFAVANDFHHFEAACDPWFAALFRQIAAHEGVGFCLGLGDLAHKGAPGSIAAVARLAREAGLSFHTTPGNHDNDLEENTAIFDRQLPGQLNYRFEHRGWQFVLIDSTEGKKWGKTNVQPATLAWLDAELPKLDRAKPLVLATHFPLASSTPLCPLNAEEVLARFVNHNLRLVLGGHHHGRTEVVRGEYTLVTNACCSRVAGNHDGTKTKGYWLCRTQADGAVRREFVEFTGPAA
jgi:3',5'-cyclic AMP phosphodiesterase CpdA